MRVLIVDDDVDTVDVFSECLTMWGHDVRSVPDSVLAVAAALAFLPEVVLLDLSMPVLDGCEIARRMRQHPSLQTALLVAVTGHGLARDVERALAAGFDVHLLKPVDLQQLRTLFEPGRPAAGGESKTTGWDTPTSSTSAKSAV
jgi:two-component system, sensor histidine kinase